MYTIRELKKERFGPSVDFIFAFSLRRTLLLEKNLSEI
jgi:hypothetical protein